jgi:hypothetical protein
MAGPPTIRTGRASVGGTAAAAAAAISSPPRGEAFLIHKIHSLQSELDIGKAQLSRAQGWATELFTQLQEAQTSANLVPTFDSLATGKQEEVVLKATSQIPEHETRDVDVSNQVSSGLRC